MPEDFNKWIPSNEHLTTDELVEAIGIAVETGITEVRLTGGEPLLRPDIVEIVRKINQLPEPPAISMTTNGIALAKVAQDLVDAGLERINVSLDTLSPERFKAITKRDRFNEVMEGLAAAKSAGLSPIKINSVLMRGVNDDEAPALVKWAMENGYQLRFIEQMPLDAGDAWSRDGFVKADEIFESLSKDYRLMALDGRGAAPAETFLVNDGPATIGIIASISKPFCGSCDRLRLTSDGQIRSCLFSRSESNIRDVLRDANLDAPARNERISEIIRATVLSKEPGHKINELTFVKPDRPMSAIGG